MSKETNPIDLVEDLVFSHGWSYRRPDAHLIDCDIVGRWCEYRMRFIWMGNEQVLKIFLLYNITIPARKTTALIQLMSMLNNQIHIGNFELYAQEKCPAFRYSFVLFDIRSFCDTSMMALIDRCIDMIEKYYPAFYFVLLGNRKPQEVATMAMIETMGEA